MKKVKYFVLTIITSMFVTSCNDEQENLSNYIDIADVEILENNILKFKDQATFDEYVENEKTIEGFYSLINNFGDAMDEALSYYEREGGYEEFKEKYSSLYFPEYEDDYSAYLHVSDKRVANLVNPQGSVIIGNEEVNLNDVFSYSQLEELNLTPPRDNEISTRGKVLGDIKCNDRKLWINAHDKGATIVVEVCFRKKSLGVYHNYSSTTELFSVASFDSSGNPISVRKENAIMNKYSSHDYVLPRRMQEYSTYFALYSFTANLAVKFQGFGGKCGDTYYYFNVIFPARTVSK